MAIFKCKMCGGELEVTQRMTVCECPYCGTKQTLPRLDDEKKIKLYDRANHFRRNNEYDKAMGIYETILSEDSEDAEAYWSLVLCRYGIEYVEDPATHKRIPTVNRAQYTSVFIDEDYQSAIKYADGYQRDVYEGEAKDIDDIQKGILEISSKEEPFDVFICYKETDNKGRRMQDSVYAQNIYDELTKEGYKVFFSRITLEDKLGSAYEPYIFAALNSAKVMIAVGTSAENFNSAWVRNEWSRYLAMIKAGEEKTLIPIYNGMDPYDLPDEFSYLQAQDMNKIGFMQDLVRGVKKLISQDVIDTRQKLGTTSVIIDTMTRRATDALANEEWDTAIRCYESILDYDSENAMAYVGKLMASKKISEQDKLSELGAPLEKDKNYQLAIKYADDRLKAKLDEYNQTIVDRIKAKTKRTKKITFIIIIFVIIASVIAATVYIYPRLILPVTTYNHAVRLLESFESTEADDWPELIDSVDETHANFVQKKNKTNNSDFFDKIILFFIDSDYDSFSDYDSLTMLCNDLNDLRIEVHYQYACKLLEIGEYREAYDHIQKVTSMVGGVYNDSDEIKLQCLYQIVKQLEDDENYEEAFNWASIIHYKTDSGIDNRKQYALLAAKQCEKAGNIKRAEEWYYIYSKLD